MGLQNAINRPRISTRHMQEKQWVRKVREDGDRSAFENLFREYYKRLYGFAISYVEQKETAEDIVQSVFLRIWIQREKWDPPGTVKHYLFAAIRNEALNKSRHEKIITNAEEDVIISFREHHQIIGIGEQLDTEVLQKKIIDGIQKLPPRCKQIFLLNRNNGLTYTEIADYLDISINTVNTQMGRALKSLRDHLSNFLTVLIAAGISGLFF